MPPWLPATRHWLRRILRLRLLRSTRLPQRAFSIRIMPPEKSPDFSVRSIQWLNVRTNGGTEQSGPLFFLSTGGFDAPAKIILNRPKILQRKTPRTNPERDAQEKGFEPLRRCYRPTGVRSQTLQPLGYSCKATTALYYRCLHLAIPLFRKNRHPNAKRRTKRMTP